ncbi:MAG: hypothetical protein AAFY28_07855 [Actinomycetota bacterium]
MRDVRNHERIGARAAALGFTVAGCALLAIMMHRNGHTQGDDFALYLRQAQGILGLNVGEVVNDNRFALEMSDGNFSPLAYPWGWPFVLAPFVFVWDLDYDRLKLVQVAAFCLWLVLVHGIVRRRIGWLAAIGVIAVLGTSPVLLGHTDQLLSEFPHLAAVALVMWWYDRMRVRSDLLDASLRHLAILGLLVMVAYNMRREGIVLLGVIGGMQLFDAVRRNERWTDVGSTVRLAIDRWQQVLMPYGAFVGSVVVVQLLLPNDLFPDNGNSAGFLDDRFREYPANLSEQLGLGERPWVGVIVLAIAVVGAVIGVRRRPTLDLPLLLLPILSAFAIGTHFREVKRYWYQVTPWVLYFAMVAIVAVAALVLKRHTRAAAAVAAVPVLALLIGHGLVLRGDISDVRDFNNADRVQWGPANPAVDAVFDAVDELTDDDDVVAYYRARTMTLVTDRRSFQSGRIDHIAENADYFAQRRNSTYWQPDLDPVLAEQLGFVEVWSDPAWVLWRTPSAGGP